MESFLFEKKNPSLFVNYLKKLIFWGSAGLFIFSGMCLLFPKNSFLLGLFNIVGEKCFLIGFVYGFAAFCQITFPHFQSKKIIPFGIFLVIISIIIHLKFFPFPEIDQYGILRFNAHLVPGLISVIFTIFGLLFLGVKLLKEGIVNKTLRKRGFLLGGGCILIVITEAGLSLFTNPFLYISSFFLQTLAFFLLFGGLISKPTFGEPSPES
jgi:hypothetical protein